MSDIIDLEKRIEKIEVRNKVVEADKAWETSLVRKILVAVFTYLVIGLFMNSVSVSRPWLNAIVPTLGFLLSTLTLPILKKIWINKFKK